MRTTHGNWFAPVAPIVLCCLLAPAKTHADTKSKGQRLEPSAAFKALTVPADLELEQVLTEPNVLQPVFANFDERGRLWVVEYIQYPFPAGVKILSEDKFLRATYDKVPPPPPRHFPGLDKISIHEDTDGDGTFDRHTTFLEGLNVVTSFARGYGGIWVLNPPYLLFYPDRNGDDVPDADPEVHLQGFGLEDTHSCANNLNWGPDGWLYACQGSTVSGDIVRPGIDVKPVHSMGQLIWRYHPPTRRYEIFAEGGGNAMGLEIDSQGRVFSGHNGGDTRGFHYVQGGYFQKGFSKHGPLSNPFSFGYFPAMKHPNVPRFSHAFVVYDGGALPASYAGQMFAVVPLQSHVMISQVDRDGSSFQTHDLGHAIAGSDDWFRPVNITVGPDGAVYVCDMYEGQIAHLRHHEGQVDKTSGRIYRLKAKGASPIKPFDLRKLTSDQLISRLADENRWFRRQALRLLADRNDASVVPALLEQMQAETGQLALEALWAVNLCGGFDAAAAAKGLAHVNPSVRAWSARLLGDAGSVSSEQASQLAELAATEPAVDVRSQLASTARRLPAEQGLPIVRQLLGRDEDSDDIHLPLLLWWAIEAKADSDCDAVLALLGDSPVWRAKIVATHILHRLMRRYAAAGSRKELLTCSKLLAMAPDDEHRKLLMRGFEEAFQGRALSGLPDELVEAVSTLGGQSIVLGLRQGNADAIAKALTIVADAKADANERLQYVQVFGEVRQPQCVSVLLDLVAQTNDEPLRLATMTSLQTYDDARIAATVIGLYGKVSDDGRSVAQTLLASRRAWARELLDAVDAGQIDAKSLPLDVVRQLTVHRDEQIAAAVARHWGTVTGATTEEMQQQIARLTDVVRSGSGSPYDGKKLFTATCAKCHRLFGQGGQIGPDLTTFKRDDVANMLVNIVNPSAEVREGFETYQAQTDDGRVVLGFLVDRDNRVVVLRGVDGQNVTLAHDQIEELAPQRKSLMPEGQLRDLSDQQVRDLFAYLRSTQPLND
jgi:putative heme-binding domain-containing protein